MVGLWVSPKVLAQAAAAQMGSENGNGNGNASVRKPVGGTVAAAKEAALKSAAEQSIARQISNSREQRRLLVPQKLAGKRTEVEYRDGVSDRKEVIRKEVRRVPVAVDNVEKMLSMSGGLGGFGGAGNRRSEVGVLVGGAY
jgi:hypothetical protein